MTLEHDFKLSYVEKVDLEMKVFFRIYIAHIAFFKQIDVPGPL